MQQCFLRNPCSASRKENRQTIRNPHMSRVARCPAKKKQQRRQQRLRQHHPRLHRHHHNHCTTATTTNSNNNNSSNNSKRLSSRKGDPEMRDRATISFGGLAGLLGRLRRGVRQAANALLHSLESPTPREPNTP